MKTYPEMDERIVGILRMSDDNPVDLYAAQRIEELCQELDEAREWAKVWKRAAKKYRVGHINWRELLDYQNRMKDKLEQVLHEQRMYFAHEILDEDE